MIKKILLHALYDYISSCHMYVFIIYHIIMMQKSDITSYSLVSIRSCTKNINPQKMIITTQQVNQIERLHLLKKLMASLTKYSLHEHFSDSYQLWLRYSGLCFALHKKGNFLFRISSVNMTKFTVSSVFGHIYYRDPLQKTLYFVQCRLGVFAIIFQGYKLCKKTFTLHEYC